MTLTDRLPWDEACRQAAARGHALEPWRSGATHRDGEQDWWAECSICRRLVWVLATPRRVSVEHMPPSCSVPRPGEAAPVSAHPSG
jgi:hypothetical protein